VDQVGDFRCARCEAEFPTWQELDDHRRSAHLVVEAADQLRCPTCGAPLSSRPALEQHQREAHDVPTADEWEEVPVATEER
jgi:hypothetical protein